MNGRVFLFISLFLTVFVVVSPTALNSLPTTIVLPSASTPAVTLEILRLSDLSIPTPAGMALERVEIPALGLDAPVEALELMESDVPDRRAAGRLNTSAPFGLEGSTALDGHHNVMGEVFKDLWTLRPGDEIRLWFRTNSRAYRVKEILLLPEKDQPLEVRLKNAQYLQPTGDERLTLVTCWPYNNNNIHRTVAIALPVA